MVVEFQHHNFAEDTETFKDPMTKDQASGDLPFSVVFFLESSRPLALLSEGLFATPNPMLPHSFPSLSAVLGTGPREAHTLCRCCPARLHPHRFPIIGALGMELMALHMLGGCLTTELHGKPPSNFLF